MLGGYSISNFKCVGNDGWIPTSFNFVLVSRKEDHGFRWSVIIRETGHSDSSRCIGIICLSNRIRGYCRGRYHNRGFGLHLVQTAFKILPSSFFNCVLVTV
jgi:hypothetical protein